MPWGDKITVVCPVCGDSREIQDRGRGQVCLSCSMGITKKANDWTVTHGQSKTPLYRVWCAMLQRCTNSKNKWYLHYGGRGIRICDAWLESFVSFRDWAMQHGYAKGLKLDRENNNSNYTPYNCRWVTAAVSAQNTRNSKLNPQTALHIRELSRQGFNQKDMAWAFGVGKTAVGNVISGKTYRNVLPVDGGTRGTITTSN